MAGCAVGPDYAAPDPGVLPEALPVMATLPQGHDGEGGSASWYDGFGDSVLAEILGIAATNSLDILQTLARVEASRASFSGARAGYWPNIGFSASTSKSKSYNPDSDSEHSSAHFDASWEIDAFGKTRRTVEAARAELEAMEFTLEDARVSLFAEIAAEYVNLRLQEALCGIAETNLAISSEFASIAKAKFDAGVSPELDWLSASAQRESAHASLASAKASVDACLHRLELLASLPPGGLARIVGAGNGLPNAPTIPAAIPSEMLRNRPDVRRAERLYAAALARVGVAKANYFPTISIGAGFSLSKDSFANWGDAVRSIDFGPSLSWNLLSFGRNKAKVAQARANAEESALAYRAAVLSAFHEVENCAIGIESDVERERRFEEATKAQERAASLALKMYREDLGEYKDVLSAQQSLLSQRRSLLEVRADATLQKISLCKAVGVK